MEFILITNDIGFAQYAQDSGIDRIMVDLEILGKRERQSHYNTVISNHSLKDVSNIRRVLNKSKLLVRINPIHEDSKKEIDNIVNLGADVIMLPMFTTPNEVETFISCLNGRATANLLLETPAALARIDDILSIHGIDEMHIGLNDLHLGMGLNFMFELLSGGLIEYLSKKIHSAGIRFGFGGIARLGQGKLDSSLILSEHYRLNSKAVILSRDFFTHSKDNKETLDLKYEVGRITHFIHDLSLASPQKLIENQLALKNKVAQIVDQMGQNA